jgi:3-oxoacyl-[acyl-carrier-protein] synthase II
MSRPRIAVTGLGAVTAAGVGAEATWKGLLAGRSTARTDARLAGLPVDFTCAASDFDGTALLGRRLTWRIDRFIQMGLVAAREAVADARLDPGAWDGARVGVVLGVGSGSNDTWGDEYAKLAAGRPTSVSPTTVPRSVVNMLAGEISTDLGALGPSLVIATACASGTTAIGIARGLLLAGACDIVVTGGAESPRSPLTAVSFSQLGALSRRCGDPAAASRPFDLDRDGFVLGEGAGVLVLEREADATARRAGVRAYIEGFGASADGHHHTRPDPGGAGLVRAILAALVEAGLAPDDVDHVNAHGTSTPLNDAVEARALRQVFHAPPPVTANKSVLGHAIGGAGAIEAVCTVLTLQHQVIPPTANLDKLDPDIDLDVVAGAPRRAPIRAAISNSCGFGGQNAVLALTAP